MDPQQEQQPPQYPPQPPVPQPHYPSPYAPQAAAPAQGVPQPLQSPHPAKLHPMVVLQPGEQVVCTIKRHAFGIVSLYISGLIAVIIIAALAFVLLPNLMNQYDLGSASSMLYAGLGVAIVGLIVVLAVATSIYWQNEWIVTTDSITQISQNSLFNRQVSQLSMDNLEDVTVDQNGILPHLFNFGNLKVESAGERSKFVFIYCPRPNFYARKILEVHEHFLEERRNIQHRPTFQNNS